MNTNPKMPEDMRKYIQLHEKYMFIHIYIYTLYVYTYIYIYIRIYQNIPVRQLAQAHHLHKS
jgi:hypothetical protein